ncbi:FadR/GntR family transcriptional regulator [Ancylobacter defluvii]|uniref:Transcriptional regulator n=1 Tax=Ancylobacter defluvii TaxID=1282440 RepID=A0A9W6JZJ8_9HYPH|nr:FadR/GntR family transcriptional regulator [Ancylobacter defluvii]MBS7587142.1 FadR family transcriptional regulator [Ancylobacter defluvii]GLK85446.1 transcriptional regulator [Ancylobacter defluvii]
MDSALIDRKPTGLVQDFLARAIGSGTYGPGAKLPTERAIAEKLGVPRSAVRDVLSVLEAQKKVVRIIGSGTYVAKASPTAEPVRAPSDASPTEIMAARLIVEPRLAQLVVMNATAGDFERMEACNRQAEAADDFEEFEKWDAALHQAIAEATHNRLMIAIYATITAARDHADWGELKRRSITAERRDLYRQEHREIVAALRARDGREAEAATARHLVRVKANLLGE